MIEREGTDVDVDVMLQDLRTLVEVESPSRDLVALRRSAEAVAALVERRLGGRATLVDGPAGTHVRWEGGGEPRVLVLGHHDTVFPLGTLEHRPFRVEGGRATGPGVYDMLGGLVQAIHGLATLADPSGVELLVTADEEVGSHHSRALIEERARACGTVLVFEGAAEGGHLKVARKGCGTFEVAVRGLASHAGLEPEAGVNAPVEAALTNLTPRLAGAEITVTGSVNRPPMQEEMASGLPAQARRSLPGVEGVAVGGGSDGNFTAALGVPTLDGLGAVGGGAHADHEYLVVGSMAERARLAAAMVRAIRS